MKFLLGLFVGAGLVAMSLSSLTYPCKVAVKYEKVEVKADRASTGLFSFRTVKRLVEFQGQGHIRQNGVSCEVQLTNGEGV